MTLIPILTIVWPFGQVLEQWVVPVFGVACNPQKGSICPISERPGILIPAPSSIASYTRDFPAITAE